MDLNNLNIGQMISNGQMRDRHLVGMTRGGKSSWRSVGNSSRESTKAALILWKYCCVKQLGSTLGNASSLTRTGKGEEPCKYVSDTSFLLWQVILFVRCSKSLIAGKRRNGDILIKKPRIVQQPFKISRLLPKTTTLIILANTSC